MRKREEFGNKADTFFDSLDEPIAALAQELRGIIRKAVPHASESIKWGMPVYEENGMICAIRPSNSYVALQFTSGTDLHDPDGLLEGTGKTMRHVKIRSNSEIDRRLFTAWLKQAANKS